MYTHICICTIEGNTNSVLILYQLITNMHTDTSEEFMIALELSKYVALQIRKCEFLCIANSV